MTEKQRPPPRQEGAASRKEQLWRACSQRILTALSALSQAALSKHPSEEAAYD
jgi:hypothetical protein